MDNIIKFHDTNEIKTNIVSLGNIDNEIKSLQERLRDLRTKKTGLSENIKQFMQINELETCKLSPETPTHIDRIRFCTRKYRERMSVKFIKEHIGTFFANIDIEKFRDLTSDEKTGVIFEYIDEQRKISFTNSISIKKKSEQSIK
ncbi:hypothetical protein [Heterosigma akashiwo virus 01]|jgi:hypothetical protein|uniref:Uncharacterized protein n=1 Tax=Heterosigma akashiwo virus 01 TaxID=97195 RepID=A0A1C9C514_HAV01|nr:hypothetical protein D1R72_gp041 [Heterosigma akashiwo virus 01]AOM63372.1 hypothetical protein [Heterosigma akashiwo virus 01]